MNYNIKELISREEVTKRIQDLGTQISKDYEGKRLKVICVLKGGVFFLTDLAKEITIPAEFDFMSVSSYGSGTESSGLVKIIKDLDETIEGQDVLVVEDIVDSGNTLSHLLEMLKQRRPASLKLCTLLSKPARRQVEVKIDYLGFEVPDIFIVGYGLDYDQKLRNLPYIGAVEFID